VQFALFSSVNVNIVLFSSVNVNIVLFSSVNVNFVLWTVFLIFIFCNITEVYLFLFKSLLNP